MASRVAGEPEELALVDGAIALTIDLRCYRLSAVKKTAYRLADRATAVLGALDGDRLALSLQFRPGITEAAARDTARLFFQDLLDQELREQIADDTSALRTLILAHAFSNVDLIKRE